MEHHVNVIVDFMGNSCAYVIIKYKKWNTQTGFGTGLILEMICTCNEVTFKRMGHSIITDMIIIIITSFMILTNITICFMCVKISQLIPILYDRDDDDANFDIIYFDGEIDLCHLEVQ